MIAELDAALPTLATDRFELRGRLGEGGGGVVYEAYDREHERSVALKLLPDLLASDVGRLKHEFRVLADVVHPNLVRLHELVSDGTQWFFAMELVRGVSFLDAVREAGSKPPPNLAELETQPVHVARAAGVRPEPAWERRAGRLREPELREALRQLTRGVLAIHAAGKLHCDLKPLNVLVTPEGRVVVLDFGLVVDKHRERPSEPGGSISGTPAYMAPEQAVGAAVTEASDWYAVGVMLYEALTGVLPFGGSLAEILENKQSFDAPHVALRAPALPDDLCELCMALLQRDPELRPTGAQVLERLGGGHGDDAWREARASMPPSQQTLPLVGRARELALLEQALAVVRRGQPVSVYVHGQAGIGKSRLLQELLARVARDSGAVVLAGRCYERERLPFKAFDSVVDALTAHLRRLPEAEVAALLPRDVHSLARLFPTMLRVPAIAHAPRPSFEVMDPHALRRRAFAAVKELLARIADRAPLVVHIDDVHWGDVDSAALLVELLGPPDPPAMLLVASFRSGPDASVSPFLGMLLAEHPPSGALPHSAERSERPHVLDLPLPPLSQEESVQLAEAFRHTLEHEPSEAHATSTRSARVIAVEAAGNPFFVAQLVRYVATHHDSSTLGGQTVTLEHVLRERLAALPAPALALLETVAIAGHPIPCDVAIEAAQPGPEADAALSLLRAGAWLRSQGPGKTDAVECFHDRVREVVTQSLAASRSRACHERIALTLERSARGTLVDLAEHFRAAEQPERAAHYAQRAAEQAAYALAFDEAARWYELSLSLGRYDGAQLTALREKLGDALANAGRAVDAAQTYVLAADHAEPHLVLELRRRAAEQWLVSGHIDEGVATLGSVLQAAHMRLAKTPQRALLSLLVQRARVKLRGLSWQRREQASIAPQDLMRIDTCWSVATGLATVDTIRAADFQARHLLLALAAGEPYRVARALTVEAGFAATSGRTGRQRMERVGAVALELALELEDTHPHALGLSRMMTGMSAYLMGQWVAALRECDGAERILLERCTGVLWELTNTRRFALSALAFLGELAEIGRRAPKLLIDARERGNLYAETDLRARLMTLWWLKEDKPDEASAHARDALARWTQQGFLLQHYNEMFTQLQCELYRGDARAALERIERVWPALERSLLLRIQALRSEILHARGRALLGMGARDRERGRAVEKIARQLDRERMPWIDPLAASLRAGLAAQRGELETARSQLQLAADAFTACDMTLHAAGARMRLSQLLGGTQGEELRTTAESYCAAQAIVAPERFLRFCMPGFD